MTETIRGVAAAAFIGVNSVVWCLQVYLLALVRPLLPAAARIGVGTAMFRAIDGWVVCVRTMMRVLGVTRIDLAIESEAGEMRRDGRYLVLSNHQSWADIVVLVVGLYRTVPQFKFFTKRELRWLPFLGLALWLLDFPYVRRYGREKLAEHPELADVDRRATLDACKSFAERPTSVLNFVEGTRFSTEKHAAQQSPYRRLLRPKSGGVALVLEGLEGQVDAVVDVTIVYDGAVPGFWDFLCGRCGAVRLWARALPAPASDRDVVRAWVGELWAAKDRRLAALAKARQ